MEWIGHLLIGILVLGGISQLFWAYTISAIAQKTDQSELMQVLAWIPLLQVAPTLVAGGASVGRFLIGMIALIVGNGALIAMAALLGDSFGSAVAAFGLVLTGLLCLFYFGRIACNTATARDLPGWMGLLLFVPILNFFVYPYFAFHDGWVSPNKVGLVIGSVLVIGGMAPTFNVVHLMNENGGPSSALLLAMSQTNFADLAEAADIPLEISVDSADPTSIASLYDLPISSPGSPSIPPRTSQSEGQTIRVLYQLKTRFDTLNSLATPESLLVDDHRVRALGIVQAIRRDLEAQRETLDASTYGELATHLLDIEARVHARSTPSSVTRGSLTTTRKSQFAPAAPAALDPAGRTKTPSYSDSSAPPVRPYPVQASNECPEGTESRTRKHDHGEDEWCQQLSAFGGLRHGWYARYHEDGRPESMGQYENGLRVSVWTRFYPTGEVRAQAEFREGMQHGWVLTFNKAGERTRSARFEGGAPVLTD
jgi:hypothetical protein